MKIFAHTPVLTAQISTESLPDEELFLLHRTAVERLPDATREKFLELHGHFGGDGVYDRFQTNGFRIFDYAGVFPETSVSSPFHENLEVEKVVVWSRPTNDACSG